MKSDFLERNWPLMQVATAHAQKKDIHLYGVLVCKSWQYLCLAFLLEDDGTIWNALHQ